jgi:hypothetical protein
MGRGLARRLAPGCREVLEREEETTKEASDRARERQRKREGDCIRVWRLCVIFESSEVLFLTSAMLQRGGRF